jgi:hypothetical protein
MTANRRFVHLAPAALFAALTSLSGVAMAGVSDEPVKVNVERLQRHVAEQVQKHADEGLDSLMAYLWFTRKQHRLWIEDVTGPEAEAIARTEKKEYRAMVTRTTGVR